MNCTAFRIVACTCPIDVDERVLADFFTHRQKCPHCDEWLACKVADCPPLTQEDIEECKEIAKRCEKYVLPQR